VGQDHDVAAGPDAIVPRSNASVRAPCLVSSVNWPYMPPSLRSRASRPWPPSTALSAAAWVDASWVADEADREIGVAADVAGEPVASATANAPPPAATAAISRPAVHRRRRPAPAGPPPVGPVPAGPEPAQGSPPPPSAASYGAVGG
jgi:hypothetical protein